VIIAGIICEYNPLHNGHARHIAETRDMTGANAVICVMSGNFVQRGDFAMFGKHPRAAAAVRAGADLVIELPSPWALASAERFAYGGVSLLDSMGVCDYLSFGSECGDTEKLKRAAELILTEEAGELIKQSLQTGISYAAAREAAVRKLDPGSAVLLRSPNDILAVEYLKALTVLETAIEPVTVTRKGAGHDSVKVKEDTVSASFLRGMLADGEDPAPYMPREAAKIFNGEVRSGKAPVLASYSEAAILARLRTMNEAEFAALPDSSEGLYRRFMRYAKTEPTVRGVIVGTKTRRYAESRLRRMLMCAYLGITAEDSIGTPPYARVLAFNKAGQEILREASKVSRVPIITKPASVRDLGGRASEIFEKEARATDLYALSYPGAANRVGGLDWTTSPMLL